MKTHTGQTIPPEFVYAFINKLADADTKEANEQIAIAKANKGKTILDLWQDQHGQEAYPKLFTEKRTGIFVYAPHVTMSTIEEMMEKQLANADKIRDGECNHQFWLWQRINHAFTGECVALLP